MPWRGDPHGRGAHLIHRARSRAPSQSSAVLRCSWMDVHDRPQREVIDLLEEVLLLALRSDPDASHDSLAERMMSERRAVRVWTIGPLLTAQREITELPFDAAQMRLIRKWTGLPRQNARAVMH
jgi:hypothetical protein